MWSKRDKTLKGFTLELETACGPTKITVNEKHKKPYELFIQETTTQCCRGLTDGIARLVSALLRFNIGIKDYSDETITKIMNYIDNEEYENAKIELEEMRKTFKNHSVIEMITDQLRSMRCSKIKKPGIISCGHALSDALEEYENNDKKD
jgi:hypothetical protein